MYLLLVFLLLIWRGFVDVFVVVFFFQAEDGIRDLVRSRGLGDVYKRQVQGCCEPGRAGAEHEHFYVFVLIGCGECG
mgnify:CR=1 FL=1